MMKDCMKFTEEISACLDGALSAQEEVCLFMHLESCPECRLFFEQAKGMAAQFAQKRIAAPAGFHTQVMARIVQEADVKPEVMKRKPPIRRLIALAAVFAVVATGVWVLDGQTTPEGAPDVFAQVQAGQGIAEEQPRAVQQDVGISPAEMEEEAPMPSLPPVFQNLPEQVEAALDFETVQMLALEDELHVDQFDLNVLERYFKGQYLSYETLIASFAELGFEYQIENGILTMHDRRNPGSLLQAGLKQDEYETGDWTLAWISYYFAIDGMTGRRIEISFEGEEMRYTYGQEEMHGAEDFTRLWTFILTGR